MKVLVQDKQGKSFGSYALKSDKVEELKSLIHSKYAKLSPERQRLTFILPSGDVQVLESGNLATLQVKDGDVLLLKDLGPQIPWKTVFLIEYLGPILLHPLFYFTRSSSHTGVQTLTLIMVVLHFIKREYETLRVHRFSSSYMPFINLPKNCAHYWLLCGVLMGYEIYSPRYQPSLPWGATTALSKALVLSLWVFAQLSNLKTHYILRDLRPEGTKTRQIPQGYGFNLVSCPNYFFEIVGWVCVTLFTQSWTALLFTLVGAVQMYFWAVKKHKRYRKEFSDYPRHRRILIPFLL